MFYSSKLFPCVAPQRFYPPLKHNAPSPEAPTPPRCSLRWSRSCSSTEPRPGSKTAHRLLLTCSLQKRVAAAGASSDAFTYVLYSDHIWINNGNISRIRAYTNTTSTDLNGNLTLDKDPQRWMVPSDFQWMLIYFHISLKSRSGALWPYYFCSCRWLVSYGSFDEVWLCNQTVVWNK